MLSVLIEGELQSIFFEPKKNISNKNGRYSDPLKRKGKKGENRTR